MIKILDFIKIDINQLQEETTTLFSRPGITHPLVSNQIGLTYADDKCKNKFQDGIGSLEFNYLEWDNDVNTPIPLSTRQLREEDFCKIVPEIKDLYLGTIVKKLQEKYNVGRTRLMKSYPKTCLSWHYDSTPRIHIPITTNPTCFMVWKNVTRHLEAGNVYWVDTTVSHTAMNASFDERVHLVATVN
tara:strand:- start:869 stop:1429 length:561 start_codon:yes stop_codon:yes gene_type:complete